MELTRQQTIAGMVEGYTQFAELVDGLDEHDWQQPTRCVGFEVRDVAGHVIGLAEDVAAGVPGSRTADAEAASVRGETPQGAAKRLRAVIDQLGPLTVVLDDDHAWEGPSGVAGLTMGHGILTLWYDTFVHADDIRTALGRGAPADPSGLTAATIYLAAELTNRSWGPAHLRFVDLPDRPDQPAAAMIGADGPATTELPIAAMDFVLAATGRTDPTALGLDPAVNIYRP